MNWKEILWGCFLDSCDSRSSLSILALMLWGGHDGIASFEGMITDDLDPIRNAISLGFILTNTGEIGTRFCYCIFISPHLRSEETVYR